jgi:hypothetical protein
VSHGIRSDQIRPRSNFSFQFDNSSLTGLKLRLPVPVDPIHRKNSGRERSSRFASGREYRPHTLKVNTPAKCESTVSTAVVHQKFTTEDRIAGHGSDAKCTRISPTPAHLRCLPVHRSLQCNRCGMYKKPPKKSATTRSPTKSAPSSSQRGRVGGCCRGCRLSRRCRQKSLTNVKPTKFFYLLGAKFGGGADLPTSVIEVSPLDGGRMFGLTSV